MNNISERLKLERDSSAVTLSDMEIFLFPDLLFSLVLANIMSPLLWEWKKDPWFQKTKGLPEIQRIKRLRQFCLLYTSPSPRDKRQSRMPSSA